MSPHPADVLPHRAPMLMLDEVLEVEHQRRAVARKRVTVEDCAGHFPGHPVFPGVHLAEAMAQVAAVAFLAEGDQRGEPVYLVGYDKLRFRRPVLPGDDVRVEAVVEQERRGLVTFKVEATVGDQRVASGLLLATAPRPQS